MKNVTSLKNILFASLAMALTLTFASCGSNDDETPLPDVNTAVAGSYTGTMTAMNTPATISATVANGKLTIAKFPVSGLVTAILGEAMAGMVVPLLGDISYEIPFQASYNGDNSAINLILNPQPLTLDLSAMGQLVVVQIDPSGTAIYAPTAKKLTFALTASSVTVNGGTLSSQAFPLKLDFDLAK
jgi:hypothetical protein